MQHPQKDGNGNTDVMSEGMFSLADRGEVECVCGVWQTSGLIALQGEVGREIHQSPHTTLTHTQTLAPNHQLSM